MTWKIIKTCCLKLPSKTSVVYILYGKCWTILKVADNSGGIYCGVLEF